MKKCVDCSKLISQGATRCNSCSNRNRAGTYHWSNEARQRISGKGNPHWKDNPTSWTTGHVRAIAWFPPQPCEICGNPNAERHHKDDNNLNNEPENVQFLCRKHHMEEDGRMFRRDEGGKFR